MTRYNLKIFLIFFCVNFFVNIQAVLVSKIFYHRGKCVDKLVFYFDKMPQITKHSSLDSQSYTLNDLQLAPDIELGMLAIEHLVRDYAINFNFYKQALTINIGLNPEYISKIYATKFKPISQAAGVMIKILHTANQGNKSCIRKNKSKEIVLDFGHGGSDTGAQFGRIVEKDVVRKVGLKLTKILKRNGYQVYLTRKHDEFVPLDQRTYLANLHTQASLFISLHANHSNNRNVTGIETYYMHHDLFSEVDVASGINHETHTLSSMNLANLVHASLLEYLRDYNLVDRKVKQSVAQVLLGVEMPAILIELGFLSNPKEAQQLDNPKYQWQLAYGIYNGINAYLAAG